MCLTHSFQIPIILREEEGCGVITNNMYKSQRCNKSLDHDIINSHYILYISIRK